MIQDYDPSNEILDRYLIKINVAIVRTIVLRQLQTELRVYI